MPNYRRNFVPGGAYFFTLILRNRRSRLLTDRLPDLRDAFNRVKRARPFRLDALVILPDHLHAVWTLPEGDADYPGRWRAIKTLFAKAAGGAGIWQRGYWEHTLCSPEDYAAHIDYVHINPLKHGWVNAVVEWPWSTFHRYLAAGLYPRDWAGGVEGGVARAGERP